MLDTVNWVTLRPPGFLCLCYRLPFETGVVSNTVTRLICFKIGSIGSVFRGEVKDQYAIIYYKYLKTKRNIVNR